MNLEKQNQRKEGVPGNNLDDEEEWDEDSTKSD